MLENVTVKDIEVGVQASDWEDAIRRSARILMKANKIKESYINAMIDAVHRMGPYIVLGNHVALAHARPECGVNEPAVFFTTLNPGVSFGNENFDPVKLIITLAAIDADSHLELMSELAGILMDEENVECLVSCETPERFLQLLQQMKDED